MLAQVSALVIRPVHGPSSAAFRNEVCEVLSEGL